VLLSIDLEVVDEDFGQPDARLQNPPSALLLLLLLLLLILHHLEEAAVVLFLSGFREDEV
jgi:hypothetical protein